MISTRQPINQKLVDILQTLVKQYPDMRFSQILGAFDFVLSEYEPHASGEAELATRVWRDEFYAEPDVILARVKKALGR